MMNIREKLTTQSTNNSNLTMLDKDSNMEGLCIIVDSLGAPTDLNPFEKNERRQLILIKAKVR
jgi:hypothetical protein